MVDNKSKIAISIITTTILIYFFTIIKFTINLPYQDDYTAILDFLNNFKESTSIQEKIKLILAQHNEHRIAFNRIIEIIQFNILGEVNFSCLAFFGNLGWILVIYLIWKFSKRNKLSLLEFSPVIILLLTFSHNELMPWAMASIQQYYQILFSLLAIWSLIENKNVIAFSWLIVSVFTGSGGLVLLAIFTLYYIVKKDIKNLVGFLTFSSLLLLIFFIGLDYQHPAQHTTIFNALNTPIQLIKYFFVFLGSSIPSKPVAVIVGFSLVFIFTIKAKNTIDNQPFLFWSIIFIFGTALLTAVARSGFGIGQALSSRYTQYSLLLVSFIYLQYLQIFKDKKNIISSFCLVFSIILFTSWIAEGSAIMGSRYDILKHNGISHKPDGQASEYILNRSYKNGILHSLKNFTLPSKLYIAQPTGLSNEYCIELNNDVKNCNPIQKNYNKSKNISISSLQKTIRINGWVIDDYNKKSACGVYVVLGDVKTSFILERNAEIVNKYNNPKYLMSGFNAEIDVSNLPNGTHPFIIRTVSAGCDSYYDTYEIILVKK